MNVPGIVPDDPASSQASERERTAEQDDSAVDHMADQPRYSLQHVDPSLLPGLSETLRQMADLTELRLYFEVVGDSVSAANTASSSSLTKVAVILSCGGIHVAQDVALLSHRKASARNSGKVYQSQRAQSSFVWFVVHRQLQLDI